jgi:hypothetical protein
MVELRPQETVFYPTPYVEDEVVPLVITNQRIIQMSKAGTRHEMDAGKVTFVGRTSARPLIFLGLFFLLSGLPVVGYGVYLWLSVQGMPTFAEKPPSVENPDYEDPGTVRLTAIAFAVVGAILVVIGLLCGKRKRFTVVCRGERKVMKMHVKDSIQQMQVMMTVQAMMSAHKAMPAPVAAPVVEEKKAPQKTMAMPAPPPAKK